MRRTGERLTVAVKLWVTARDMVALEAAARKREWSVPQLIRRLYRDALGIKQKEN